MTQDRIAHFGGLDILVTNSGGPRSALFDALSEEATAAREGITAADVDRRTVATVPMGRIAIAFLASPRASYITGQTLVVDGGYVRSLL